MGTDLDVLTLWYPMIPLPKYEEHTVFLERHLLRGTHVHIMYFPYVVDLHRGGWVSALADRPYIEWYLQGDYAKAFNWAPPAWGRHGDGRCHIKTREGAPGVFMQNWHFGPLGFQLIVDSAVNMYIEVRVPPPPLSRFSPFFRPTVSFFKYKI